MTKFYQPLLRRLKLTYPQYLVLLVLWERDRCTISALGNRLFLDSGTLTPLLKRLELLGYVQRKRDVGDERRVLVTLTPAGRRLHDSALSVHEKVACATQHNASERHALTQQLRSLRGTLMNDLGRAISPQESNRPPPQKGRAP